MKDKIFEKLRKGNGEFVALAIVSVILCMLSILIIGMSQKTVALNEVTRAVSVAGRSLAMCQSIEDAEEQVREVVEASVTNKCVTMLEPSIEFLDPDDTEWATGNKLIITVSAEVQTLEPFISSGTYARNMLVTIENGNNLSASEFERFCLNMLGAIETGGQVFGEKRYDAFVGAYTNSGAETTITIGAYGFFNWNAKKLLQKILDEHPSVFRQFDIDGRIEAAVNLTTWGRGAYSPTVDSVDAQYIKNIISSTVGISSQDEFCLEDFIRPNIEKAVSMGATSHKVQALFVEVAHLGGQNRAVDALEAISDKNDYMAYYNQVLSMVGSGNGVGAPIYHSRHRVVLGWINEYL